MKNAERIYYMFQDSECKHWFRDNADMLQLAEYLDKKGCFCLPCDVGTELFLSDYINVHHRLKEYKFCGNRIAVVIDCWEWQRTCTRWLDDFGKTIFLTRKEAENALDHPTEKGGVQE